jgi:pyruvate,water dikinase
MYVIDLGGGVRDAAAAGRKVNQDQVVSAPFRALLNGMLHKGLRSMEPRPVDLKGFFSVVSQQMLSKPDMAGERFGDKSYAIISDKYLNFSSRVGYHYSILDAYCGLRVNNNYIQFQFKGGAANDLRRNRRARAIALMLEELGFEVQVTGDRVVARIQKYEQEVLQQRLESLGRLLQFTRQMDMLMVNEASVEAVAKCFREENYHFDPGAM